MTASMLSTELKWDLHVQKKTGISNKITALKYMRVEWKLQKSNNNKNERIIYSPNCQAKRDAGHQNT